MACAIAATGALVAARNAVVPDPLERLREVEPGVYEGSWLFPRGGPYVLGFERGRALWIDGVRLPVRPHPRDAAFLHAWRVYEPGVYRVRFDAGPSGRLLWHPPGRRGPPEYVPPSSLSPEPPAAARFGSGAGASLPDGLFALAIAGVWAAFAAFVLRGRLRAIDRRVAAAFAAAFALALAVRLYDLGGAGQTWDEDVNWSAGRNYVTNLLSLDFSQASWRFNYEHPPVMKYIAGIGAQFADGYGPARALSAAMMALACALLVPIGRRLWSLRVGVVAAMIAALTPHLIAHGKVVGHEAPSVLWWTLAVWLCLWAQDGPPRSARAMAPRFAAVGVVLGVAVWSRFANGLLAPLVGALLVLWAPRGRARATVGVGLAVIPAVAIAVGVAIWPRLWASPVAHLREAWAVLRQLHGPEPYLGDVVGTAAHPAPWHYFFVYFAATAPVGVLAAAGAAALRWRAARPLATVAAWMLAPMLVLVSPVKQDGVRYILPALSALALAAAVGLDAIAARARRRWALPALGAAMAAYLAAADARIHPYYLDYYNEVVGGPRGAFDARAFEVGWWGEGIDRAIACLNARAAPGAVVDKRRLQPGHVAWMRADLWPRRVQSGPFPHPSADWVLVNGLALHPFHPPPWLELTCEVDADGAPLARVYRRRGGAPVAPR
ncbi:MAG: phospholipid carrier-dependent glycosyltransferase [Deltaproteobacteria bacterium]|nr:MAG: phospholipid carrier-dependent glycosyltransferase [Deltaproteobacteria bacterium]